MHFNLLRIQALLLRVKLAREAQSRLFSPSRVAENDVGLALLQCDLSCEGSLRDFRSLCIAGDELVGVAHVIQVTLEVAHVLKKAQVGH